MWPRWFSPAVARAQAPATYVGSTACARCHAPIYDRWKRTRMANVVRDPREHPDAIIPDLTKPDPLLTFTKDQIAFVYGSKWKQRYFTKVGDDYFPLTAQWDVTHSQWRPYNVARGTDWWTAFYPPENSGRPTGPTVRRLSFGQLQRARRRSRDRMERRLREVPRSRQRARRRAFARHHHQSDPPRSGQCGERVRPVPLARAPAGESGGGPAL